MKIAAITDIGSCRQENQDNYCAQQLPGGTAWGIVCDGMGGVNGGRIAAHIATDTMQQYFARQMRSLQPGGEKSFIMRGFDITNRAVYEKATSDPEMMGMGTTGVLYGRTSRDTPGGVSCTGRCYAHHSPRRVALYAFSGGFGSDPGAERPAGTDLRQ